MAHDEPAAADRLSVAHDFGQELQSDKADSRASDDELLRHRYYLGAEQSAVAGAAIVLILTVVLWNHSSRTGLLTWTAIRLATLPIPLLIKRRRMPIERWLLILGPCEFVLGAAWAGIAITAMPRTAAWQAVLGAVLVAVLLADSVSSSQFSRAYLSFCATFLACSLVGYALYSVAPARIFLWLLPIAALYGALQAHEQRSMQRELVDLLRGKQELVANLEASNAAAGRANELLAAAAKKADRLARTDQLTQLANRREFEEALTTQLGRIDRREIDALTVAFLDLDKFKSINDEFGHEAGDALLVTLAERLRRIAGEGETIARLGGDEIVLLSPDADANELGVRMRGAFETPFVIAGRPLHIQASIGIGRITDPRERDQLMGLADSAQYAAKRAGDGAVVIFSEDDLPGGDQADHRSEVR